jgi:TolB-like protein
VVGPTTTAAHAGDGSIRTLAERYDLAFVVNARFLDDGGVLAELIRVEDGAHVWVKAYEDLDPGREIGAEIAEAVASRIVPTGSGPR